MKAHDWSDSELSARRSRIKVPEVQKAFDLLVRYGVESPGWLAGPGGHGYLKDIRFKADGKSPFSFTTNKGHLLLYVRSPGVQLLKPHLDEITSQFEDVREGSGGELKLTMRTESMASRAISLLLERWLTLAASAPPPARGADARIPWSRAEVEATVADYFAMMQLELAGQSYNKAAHNRALQRLLSNRTRSAVELKHQNISAILLELGCVYIPGYKPQGNYQGLLQEVVLARLEADEAFATAASRAVERDAAAVPIADLRGVLVEAPQVDRVEEAGEARTYLRRPVRCDYLAREARNRSLGLAGELFVAEFESRRLHAGGHSALSNRVEHVAKTRGDGLGYDVLSFEPSGRERYIEVKTTAFGPLTPFYVTRNEVSLSHECEPHFVLSRVHEFRTAPKVFELKGALDRSLQLEPVTYLARL